MPVDEMSHRMGDPLGKDTREATWSIVLSVLMIAAGGVALFVPSTTGRAVTLVLGCLLIIGGILHVAFAWRADRPAAVVWEILLAVLYGGVGCSLLVSPAVGLDALTLALALYLVLGGTLEITLAFALRPPPGRAWLLIDGVVFLLLATLIWMGWPAGSTWVVGTLVAISLLVRGLARLMLSLAMRRVLR
ncbi:MAG TPA: DUF308 domain-containing protein [Vicinamibacteria bacterium]|nr:DUF308 domain-containing protein [Vicinamibacteria bacterium]